MTDSEIKTEGFLESINSMLSTGEIAGLIPKDEKDVFALETKNVYMKEAGNLAYPLNKKYNYDVPRERILALLSFGSTSLTV